MKQFIILLSFIMGASAYAQSFHKNPCIAHRGAWKNTGVPENTMASFQKAAEMGCHGSEFDVWFTAEDSLIVYHDARRNGKLIEETPFAELRTQHLADGTPIPTLGEFLDYVSQFKHTKMIIDVKTFVNDKPRTVKLAKAIHKMVCDRGLQKRVEYLFGYLPAIEALSPITDIPMAYLGAYKKDLPECSPESVKQKGLKCLDYQDQQYKKHPEWLPEFKKMGLHLNVWTVNDDTEIDNFLSQGFNYITTNEPEKVLKIYKQNKKRYKRNLKN